MIDFAQITQCTKIILDIIERWLFQKIFNIIKRKKQESTPIAGTTKHYQPVNVDNAI